jgi:hypothetical protein
MVFRRAKLAAGVEARGYVSYRQLTIVSNFLNLYVVGQLQIMSSPRC